MPPQEAFARACAGHCAPDAQTVLFRRPARARPAPGVSSARSHSPPTTRPASGRARSARCACGSGALRPGVPARLGRRLHPAREHLFPRYRRCKGCSSRHRSARTRLRPEIVAGLRRSWRDAPARRWRGGRRRKGPHVPQARMRRRRAIGLRSPRRPRRTARLRLRQCRGMRFASWSRPSDGLQRPSSGSAASSAGFSGCSRVCGGSGHVLRPAGSASRDTSDDSSPGPAVGACAIPVAGAGNTSSAMATLPSRGPRMAPRADTSRSTMSPSTVAPMLNARAGSPFTAMSATHSTPGHRLPRGHHADQFEAVSGRRGRRHRRGRRQVGAGHSRLIASVGVDRVRARGRVLPTVWHGSSQRGGAIASAARTSAASMCQRRP